MNKIQKKFNEIQENSVQQANKLKNKINEQKKYSPKRLKLYIKNNSGA